MEKVGNHLKEEKSLLSGDIRLHKRRLCDILGYGDEVKGFDTFVVDDSID